MRNEIQNWLNEVNETRKKYWDANFTYKAYEPLVTQQGSKFIKIIDGTSVWGFISIEDGMNKGAAVKEGDLLKPASWASPAKHSRGNVLDGTAQWEYYGPTYLK